MNIFYTGIFRMHTPEIYTIFSKKGNRYMVKIITDSSALFTTEEGKAMGIDVIPLCIMINNKQFRDLSYKISDFLTEVCAGHIPSSSQPPMGEVVEAYEAYPEEEIINICMADGLSGTFQTALSAKKQVANNERIHVINSTTLCGPHRYLVEKAIRLRDEGLDATNILNTLKESMEHIHSFLIPQDFDFLKRGGRIKSTAATLGGFLKLKPIMEAVDNGSRLDKFSISRTLTKAADIIAQNFKERGVDKDYKIYISHADALEGAKLMLKKLKERFEECEFEMLELSHAFITQGGPECIAVQFIKK